MISSIEKIEEHNCEGLCSEEFCSEKSEYFTKIIIKGERYFIPLCKDHAQKLLFEEREL